MRLGLPTLRGCLLLFHERVEPPRKLCRERVALDVKVEAQDLLLVRVVPRPVDPEAFEDPAVVTAATLARDARERYEALGVEF